jgi:hypothetical protein
MPRSFVRSLLNEESSVFQIHADDFRRQTCAPIVQITGLTFDPKGQKLFGTLHNPASLADSAASAPSTFAWQSD